MANYSTSDIGKRIRERNPEAFKNLQYTDEQIGQRAVQRKPELQKLVSTQSAEKPQEGSILYNEPGIIEARSPKFQQITQREKSGEQGFLESRFQEAGQAAGIIGDVGFKVIKAITPRFIEEKVEKGVEKIAPYVAPVAEKYDEFAKKNPRAAANLESALNIGSLLPQGKAGQLLGTGTKTAVKGTAQAVLPTLQRSAVRKVENVYREIAGEVSKARKTLTKSAVREKDPIGFLARYNVIPDVQDGRINVAQKSLDLRQSADPFNNALSEALTEIAPSIPRVNLDNLRDYAIRQARSAANIANNTADDLTAAITKEFDLYKKNYGQFVDVTKIQEIKKGKWRVTPFDRMNPLQGNVDYLIGRTAKEALERVIPKDAFDIKNLNDFIGDIYDADKFLRDLDGKVLATTLGQRILSMGAGAAAGSAVGGIPGAIAGAASSSFLIDYLKRSSFTNPIRRRIMETIKREMPESYQRVLDFIDESKRAKNFRKALPEKASQPSTIELPGAGILQGQQNIRQP